MGKNVQLILTGCQHDGTGAENITETRAPAEYYEKNGSFYILYEDFPEEMKTPVKNRIKVKNSVLELTRRGSMNTRMVFEAGKEHITDYMTPYGTLKMAVYTRALEISSQEGKTTIHMEYILSSDGRRISDCVLTVSILPLT